MANDSFVSYKKEEEEEIYDLLIHIGQRERMNMKNQN